MTARDHALPLMTAGLLLLSVLYTGSYLALLDPQPRLGMHSSGMCFPTRDAEYRAGGDAAQAVFWPANWVDRQLRPRYWDERPR